MKNDNIKNEKGFALVAVLVVIVIIAVIFFLKSGLIRKKGDSAKNITPIEAKKEAEEITNTANEYTNRVNEEINK